MLYVLQQRRSSRESFARRDHFLLIELESTLKLEYENG